MDGSLSNALSCEEIRIVCCSQLLYHEAHLCFPDFVAQIIHVSGYLMTWSSALHFKYMLFFGHVIGYLKKIFLLVRHQPC